MSAGNTRVGFSPPGGRVRTRRRSLVAQIVASAALVLSIVVTVTAVSIEIARADVLAVARDASAECAAAVLLTFVLLVMGALTAITAGACPPARPGD
jgi:membrane-associated PAP2 superfamily phosphatase